MKRVVHRNWRVNQSKWPEKEEWEQWQAAAPLLQLLYLFYPHGGEDKSAPFHKKFSPWPILSSCLFVPSSHVTLSPLSLTPSLHFCHPPVLLLFGCHRGVNRTIQTCVQLTDPPQAHIVMRQWLCGCYHLINQAWVAHWGCAAASFKLYRSSCETCLC